MHAPTVDDEIRALFHGPLGDFTGVRQALAKRLRKAGDDRADEVAGLRKPSLSAWAVNQLFAHEARAMAAFVAAGERARAEQGRVAAGGDAAPLREALAIIRGETARLAARGVELLAASQRAPGEEIVERIRTDLEALALDPEAGPVAARAWLDADLAAPGFEVMAALQLAAAGGRPPAPALPGGTARAAPPAPVLPGRPPATVHRIDEARGAAATRQAERRERQQAAELDARERRERQQRERERRERRARLAAELSSAEKLVRERRLAAQRTLEIAERATASAAEAERRAAEARAQADEARAAAADGEAALERTRRELASLDEG
jgi:hypothetical protein